MKGFLCFLKEVFVKFSMILGMSKYLEYYSVVVYDNKYIDNYF